MEGAVAEAAFMAASAGKAFITLMDPVRLMYQRRVPPAWGSIRQDPTGNLLNAMLSATASAGSYLLAMRPDQK
jgi:hypothetical protein